MQLQALEMVVLEVEEHQMQVEVMPQEQVHQVRDLQVVWVALLLAITWVAVAVVLVQLEEQEMAQLDLGVTQEQEQFHQLQEHLFSMLVAVEALAILQVVLLGMGLLVGETVVATTLAQIHLQTQVV
jgi:uncharacterized metal-binding protein